MSFDEPPSRGRPTTAERPVPHRRRRTLVWALLIVAGLAIAFTAFSSFYAELLWYRNVGYTQVFSTRLLTRAGLFVFFGLVMAGSVLFSMWAAHRWRPIFRGLSPEQQSLDRYRAGVDPFRRWLALGVAAFSGLLGGAAAASAWQEFLLFRHSQRFGVNDAQFATDVGFFVFRLPFYQFLVGFGFAVVVVSLIANVATHYLYGGLRVSTPGEKTTPAARVQLAVLLGLFVLLKALAYRLDRYALVVQDGNRFSGAGYTDINAVLPAKTILFWIALICALLFFAVVFTRNWTLPALGFGLLVLAAVAIGGVYPQLVQQFSVRPSEPEKEAPYINRNLEATRAAYDLTPDKVKIQQYNAATIPQPGALAGDKATVSNVRLLDPAVVSPTFDALQQVRGFYSFADSLDVDRYPLGTQGTERDAVVAVRELNLDGLNPGQRNWANVHTTYTHGYGLVAAYGNTVTASGEPDFFVRDLPPQGRLKVEQPRIYFGEQSTQYSVVGVPDGASPRELDYPEDSAPNGQATYTYTGKGGVPIGNLFQRMVFAAKFSEGNLLLSDRMNDNSQIMWNRTPRERVQAVAPWMEIDGDPYPAVVNGRVIWILDGYTTSNGYPYAQRTTLGDVTTDSLTVTSGAVVAQPREQVNYIRNSVKAVVDSYDGTVSLYAWDATDPVLKAWESAFGGTVKPFDAIAPELKQHMRYPEDLFKVQRELLTRYHITDPQAFYSGSDYWRVPNDPTESGAGAQKQPPYYLTLQMPDQDAPAFSLTTTFSPNNRETLAAFMAVDADPSSSDYGTIRILRLPGNTTVPGPGQVQNQFESDPRVAQELTLLRQGGSDVRLGNLLSLPVGGGMLYVEPVYVKASGGTSYPLLQRVLVSFGNRIGFAETFQEALDEVFQGNSGTDVPGPSGGDGGSGGSGGGTGGTGTQQQQLAQAIADAQKALADAQAALARGDFAAYGEAQRRLADAINRASALSGTGAAPSPSPGATASPSPSQPEA